MRDYHKQIKNKLKLLFTKNLKIKDNKYCKKCNPKIKLPLLPWHVGKEFHKNDLKILFVGKPHRGTPGEIIEDKMIDPEKKSRNLFFEKNAWAYWSYTKEIMNNFYKDSNESWNKLAMTNIVKCTNNDGTNSSKDFTTENMIQQCVSNNNVIFEELKIIKPEIVIFYTWHLFREILREFPKDFELIQENTSHKYKKCCGEKEIGWWDRTFRTAWTDNLRILVTSHPGRKNKNDYVNLISNWIE